MIIFGLYFGVAFRLYTPRHIEHGLTDATLMAVLFLFIMEDKLSITETSIKNYFESVLEKKNSGEKFPVSLDYVWPISYSEKGKAVRALTNDFIEGVDFEVFASNGKNYNGGRPENIYKLSVPCLEFFIARKVRSIFDVYRQVFHRAVELSLPDFTDPAAAARAWAEQYEQRQIAESKVVEMLPKADFYDAVTGSPDTVDIGTVAKLLNFPKIGRTKLFAILRDEKVLMNNNRPFQSYVDKGWFRVIESSWNKPDGSTHVNFKTVVFQKGIEGIRKILTNKHQ